MSLSRMLEQVVSHYNRPSRTNRCNRSQSRQAASGTWINDVEATIYAQLSGLRTTQDVGQLVGMSPKHLSQKFRQAFGLTVAEYLRRERLNAAAYLVAHTDWPLLHIADHVGYSSTTLLHRAWAQKYPVSPLQWRHQQRLAGTAVKGEIRR